MSGTGTDDDDDNDSSNEENEKNIRLIVKQDGDSPLTLNRIRDDAEGVESFGLNVLKGE